jgi:hypothetical protein
MAKKLCKYVLEFHRSSDLEGVFIMTDEEIEAVKDMEGCEVRYGEVAGKHSDVECELRFSDIQILSEKEEEIAFFERLFPEGVGFSHKTYWFNTDRAYDDGWEAGGMKCYKDVNEAFEDYRQHDNNVMRKVFAEGFKKGRNN